MRVAALIVLALASCDREERRFEEFPAAAHAAGYTPMTPLHAGFPPTAVRAPAGYDENAWAVSEGKVLYRAFNCNGCHAHGGGDIGPPLMDADWIYGSDPMNIFDTIVEGRPNGMPSFRGKIAHRDVWKLVAYVRSMSGLVPDDAASARDDHLHAVPSPQVSDEPERAREEAPHP